MILMMATSLYTAGVHSSPTNCNGEKRKTFLLVSCSLGFCPFMSDGQMASAATKWLNLLATNLG